MFSNNGKISERQMIRLLVMDMFTGACLFLPMALPRTAGNGGFLAYVIGILLTWGYGWLVAKNVENSSMKKWMVRGKDVGALFCRGVYFFRYFASYVFLMGLFITVLQETFLYSMPKWMITGAMLIVLIYGSRKGLEVRARLAEIFFYIILIPILLIGFFSLPEARWERLLIFEGLRWQDIAKGTLITWVIMAPTEWVMFLSLDKKDKCCRENSKNYTHIMNKSIVLGGLLSGIIYILCQTVLSVPGMLVDRWPTVILMQIMKIPGGFVSRQDGFMLSFWIFAMFMSLSGSVIHATELIKKRNTAWLSGFIVLGGIIALKTQMQQTFLNIYFYGLIGTGILSFIILFGRWLMKSKTQKYGRFLCVVFVLTFGLCGCDNYVELENRDFVMAMGVDAGVSKKYQFTFSFPDISELTGGETKRSIEPLTIEADTLEDAEQYYNQMSENKLDYGQLKVIIFGNTILLQKKTLDMLIDEIKNTPKITRTIYVCRCRTLASNLISIEGEMEASVGVYLEKMFKNQKLELIFNEWMLTRDVGQLPVIERKGKRIGLKS